MTPLQALVIIFSLIVIVKLLSRLNEKKITLREFTLWFVLWAIVIIISSLPSLLSPFTRFLGITRNVDLLVYTSIVVLFYLMLEIFIRLDKINQDITKIVRHIGIEESLGRRKKTTPRKEKPMKKI
jgi:hypothetical protein